MVGLVVAFLVAASAAFAKVVVDAQGTVLVKSGQVLSTGSGSSGSGSSGSSEDADDDKDVDEDDDEDIDEPDEDADEVEETIPLSQVPAVVLDAAKTAVPGITFTKAEREQEGTQVEYELEGTVGSVKYKIKVSEAGKVLRVRTEERTRTEVKDGVRIRTRVEDGRTRIEVVEGGNKLKFEQKDGRVRLKVETETGEEIELEEDDEVTIEARTEDEELRLRAAFSKTIIQRLRVQALTSLPISVNLETNELTVTTPAGVRVVTVLPDQAVANMLAANTIDKVVGDEEATALLRQANIEPLRHVLELKIHARGPVYEVRGEKEIRFLGFWRLKVKKTVLVSAETGEVVKTDQSFIDRFLTSLSVPA